MPYSLDGLQELMRQLNGAATITDIIVFANDNGAEAIRRCEADKNHTGYLIEKTRGPGFANSHHMICVEN